MKNIYLEKSLGLDIRDESVAITLLGKTLRSVHIIACDFFQIPPLFPVSEKPEKYFLDSINRFMIQTNVWPENAVVSFPRHLYSFQSFELPAPNLKSVRSMIGFELERHFSSKIENLYFGYHARKKKENLFHITSAAIKKETVDYYLQLLLQLNIKPGIIEIPTFANINLVLSQATETSSLAAMIDVGPRGIDLSLLKNRSIQFCKNIPLNDPDFKKGFFAEGISAPYYEAIAKGLGKIIIAELQTALESSRNIEGAESVEMIYLIGGGPYSPFLAKELQAQTEVSTFRVKIPEFAQEKSGQKFSSSLMATSFSLGLRELKKTEIETNLLPPSQKPRKKKANIKVTIGLSAAAIFLLIGLFINKIVYNKVTLAKLEQQLQDVKGQAESFQRIDSEFDSLKQALDTLNSIEQAYPPKLPVLAELSRTLPGNTWLTNLKLVKNSLEISGYSETASQLVPIMEKSAYFKETGFMGTILREKEGEKFTIRTDIQVNP